ncbi:MAG: Ppx/GppA family phosphatase [Aestuariivita sp.]|nr:Ppx/GppA family phosphatase [Aestuariivita sp.]MCY4203234.1 Ppx/GppA family phosphatase [Aestuariivita sp.]
MTKASDQTQPDWSPFGKPLFDDPSVRRLARVGVVDVGSNSVRLVVFNGAARSPAYFFNEKIMCALGEGLAETGILNQEGRVRALAAIKRFQLLAEGMELPALTAIATAAIRDAQDGDQFCQQVKKETGLLLRVVSGEEEARLSAQGVLLGWPGSFGLVCDIGGSSMELAEIREGEVGRRATSNLGPLKLRDLKGGKKAKKAFIKQTVDALAEQFGLQRDRLFLVGGSWRAIARIDMERRQYPLHVLHEYRMSATSVAATAKYLASNDLEEVRITCGLSSARMSLVPYAIEVLRYLVRKFRPKDIAISSYGIREGMLYEIMPQAVRDRDPLIEACRFAESKDARMPGFGRSLFQFVLPLFGKSTPAELRLIKAACLLHDVSWRAHPVYRAETCFDNATRANLGGLKHSERVYLGLALLHRYRNRREGTRFDELSYLLNDREQLRAEVLGKAMRFGAMFSMQPNMSIGQLRWKPRKKLLELRISKTAKPLYGEVAQARLLSLATALNASVKVKSS